MSGLPTGTVTFFLTDVEGSTRLWEEHPDAMREALARHDRLFEEIVGRHAGFAIRPRGEGDSRFAVFPRVTDGVAAAVAFQIALVEESSGPVEIRVRAALHTGEADLRDGDYYGSAVNRCARLRGIAHGGQTLVSQAAAELVRDAPPEKVTLKDLGDHRLRDLARPERVYQVCHPDLPDEFDPLGSLEAVPNNLPMQQTTFVGRRAEIAEVERLLEHARMLTLTGAAGCGKTRLALHVGAEVLDRFPDGVWLVDLAPVPHPDLVPEEAASALGVHRGGMGDEADPQTAQEATIEHLRTRKSLLILDNCEHVVRASAVLTESILRVCPGVSVIATSREPLGVTAETTWRVPSLSAVDLDGPVTVADLAAAESTALFMERARQVRPAFEPSDEDAEAIASICARLDGIPLAIELAAARVKVLAPQQIAARLDDRFRFLVGGARTALERQQTLRAAVDWSYELLSDPEKSLLRRLSVFAGSFSYEAAEAVCTGEGVDAAELLDLLQGLIDKSWLQMEEQGGAARYRLLETFRQYGREALLASGEVGVMRTRHRDFFLALVEDRPDIRIYRDEQDVLRITNEHDNIRAAIEWSLADEQGGEKALRFCDALHTLWLPTGGREEGIRWTAAALGRAEGVDPSLVLRTRIALGMLRLMGAEPAARADLEAAVAMASTVGSDLEQLRAQVALARVRAYFDDEAASAITVFAEAAERFHEAGERWDEADVHIDLSFAHRLLERVSEARENAERALALGEELGDRRLISLSSGLVSNYALTQGDIEAARRYATDIELKDALPAAHAGRGTLQAAIHYAEGDYAGALARLEAVLPLIRRHYTPLAVANVHSFTIVLLVRLGELDRAASLVADTEAAFEALGDGRDVPMWLNLVTYALAVGDTGKAIEYVKRGLARGKDTKLRTVFVMDALARVLAPSDPVAAARILGASDATLEASGLPRLRPAVDALADVRQTARESAGPAAFDAAYEEGRRLGPEEARALLDEFLGAAREV